jgi:hypothetical protein
MSKYEKWLKNPARFLSMTGYTIDDFHRLLPYFEQSHDHYLKYREMSGKRKKGLRRSVIYQSSPLPTHAERLCFVLFFLKHNPVQEVLADLFDMDQRQANEYAHGLSTVLSRALELAQAMPARSNEGLQALLNNMEIKELVHDGSEREVPRPQDSERQKANYSGKKKRHMVKNGFVASLIGLVLFVSPTVAGSVHDKRIAETYSIPSGITLWQDTGYQGYAPDGVEIIQPTKKPKGRNLTEDEKSLNRGISSIRVRIEHFIGGVKRYRIVKDECRAYKNDFRDNVIGACTGLYNFRISAKLPQYPDNQ